MSTPTPPTSLNDQPSGNFAQSALTRYLNWPVPTIITGSPSTRGKRLLLLGNALPRDLPVFLAVAGTARRRREDHPPVLETHAAHLIAADAARIRGGIDPGDQPRAVEGVIAAIGAVLPAAAGRQFRAP